MSDTRAEVQLKVAHAKKVLGEALREELAMSIADDVLASLAEREEATGASSSPDDVREAIAKSVLKLMPAAIAPQKIMLPAPPLWQSASLIES